MENHNLLWVNQLQMAIFNSYVKLPEGNFHTFFQTHFGTPSLEGNRGCTSSPTAPPQNRSGVLEPWQQNSLLQLSDLAKWTIYDTRNMWRMFFQETYGA